MSGFGLGEIALGLVIMVVALGGVLFYVLMQQRAALDESKKPSLPPEREKAAPVPAPASAPSVIVHLHAGESLAEQLRAHANTAESQRLRPFVEFGAVWCPPSKLFGQALSDPRMEAALAGVYLIRVDTDEFGNDALLTDLRVMAVPAFYELDADGRPTGRKMTGDAWGADTIENMSAAMARFCA
jgi:thiol:disulfide interchange protein